MAPPTPASASRSGKTKRRLLRFPQACSDAFELSPHWVSDFCCGRASWTPWRARRYTFPSPHETQPRSHTHLGSTSRRWDRDLSTIIAKHARRDTDTDTDRDKTHTKHAGNVGLMKLESTPCARTCGAGSGIKRHHQREQRLANTPHPAMSTTACSKALYREGLKFLEKSSMLALMRGPTSTSSQHLATHGPTLHSTGLSSVTTVLLEPSDQLSAVAMHSWLAIHDSPRPRNR